MSQLNRRDEPGPLPSGYRAEAIPRIGSNDAFHSWVCLETSEKPARPFRDRKGAQGAAWIDAGAISRRIYVRRTSMAVQSDSSIWLRMKADIESVNPEDAVFPDGTGLKLMGQGPLCVYTSRLKSNVTVIGNQLEGLIHARHLQGLSTRLNRQTEEFEMPVEDAERLLFALQTVVSDDAMLADYLEMSGLLQLDEADRYSALGRHISRLSSGLSQLGASGYAVDHDHAFAKASRQIRHAFFIDADRKLRAEPARPFV